MDDGWQTLFSEVLFGALKHWSSAAILPCTHRDNLARVEVFFILCINIPWAGTFGFPGIYKPLHESMYFLEPQDLS